MPTSRRAAVLLNLGPNAPIETVSSALSDISTVCEFGGKLQEQVSRARAVREIRRSPEPWLPGIEELEEGYFGQRFRRYPYPPDIFTLYSPEIIEAAIAAYLREYRLDDDEILVERIEYSNPFGIIVALGAVGIAVLQIVRDWPARIRINRATADDYEDKVRIRKRLRQAFVDQMIEDGTPVPPGVVESLLTDDVTDAFRALGNARLNMNELEPRREEEGRDGDTEG